MVIHDKGVELLAQAVVKCAVWDYNRSSNKKEKAKIKSDLYNSWISLYYDDEILDYAFNHCGDCEKVGV